MNNISSSLHVLSEQVILVDAHDQILKTSEKLAAHHQGLLHRAFSIFIFRENNHQLELLLQQRAAIKYHSGGLWTNTCCGHPRPDEITSNAAARRLFEEMGLQTTLYYLDHFIYQADVGDGLIEHEYDHIFYGIVPNDHYFSTNPQEVAAVKWLDIASITTDYTVNPHHYTAWFKQAFDVMCAALPRLSLLLLSPAIEDNVNA